MAEKFPERHLRHIGNIRVRHVLKDGRCVDSIEGYIISAEKNKILYKQLDHDLYK